MTIAHTFPVHSNFDGSSGYFEFEPLCRVLHSVLLYSLLGHLTHIISSGRKTGTWGGGLHSPLDPDRGWGEVGRCTIYSLVRSIGEFQLLHCQHLVSPVLILAVLVVVG
jgi:hypothetical protein